MRSGGDGGFGQCGFLLWQIAASWHAFALHELMSLTLCLFWLVAGVGYQKKQP